MFRYVVRGRRAGVPTFTGSESILAAGFDEAAASYVKRHSDVAQVLVVFHSEGGLPGRTDQGGAALFEVNHTPTIERI